MDFRTQKGEVYAVSWREKVAFISSLSEMKIVTKDFVICLDKLSNRWSAVRRRLTDEVG